MARLGATFIAIGAQKCATTWLAAMLRQCPDVRVSQDKEVDFFSHHFDRGFEWYDRHFASDPARRHRGEISPSYFIHRDAPARAAAYDPGLQIFVILRDPVDRAYSNHLHEVRKGHVSGMNLRFEAALDNNPLYLDQGRYATHLRRWLDWFPPGQVHILFQEDISRDGAEAARRVTGGLDLPPLTSFIDLRTNESVRYRNAALGETLWKIGNAARRRGLGHLVETVKAAPGIRQIRDANRQSIRDVVAPMRADTERRLTEFFTEEVAQLAPLIGRMPPWQRFGAARAA
ncbi:MAG: sulfotransferase domain-containing protein [Thalassovita sp.]|nr:sulfotransferase domain-containing protein [Thalassovita sp.]